MNNEEKVQYWIELSDEDLLVADTMLQNGHRLYTGFMCHQSIEKIIKGYYVQFKKENPPLLHDLSRLTQQAGLYNSLVEQQIDFLNELNPLNVAARYPDYKRQITKMLTDEKCQYFFSQTTELQLWIKEKILSAK